MHEIFDRKGGRCRLPAWSRRAPLALLVLALDACHAIFPYSASRDGGGAPGDGDLALGERGGDVRARDGREGGPDGGFPKGRCTTAGWCWEHPLPQGNRLNAVWGSDENNVYAVGDAGTILHCDAKSCSAQPAPSGSACLLGIWGSSAQDIYVVGEHWTVLHNDGKAWSTVTLPGTPPSYDNGLNAVWGSGPGDVFIVGDGGTMFRYDGGWSRHDTPSAAYLRTVGGTGVSSPVYVAGGTFEGSTRYLVAYEWSRAGASWKVGYKQASATAELSALWVDPTSGDVVIAGQDVAWKKSGTSWAVWQTGLPINGIWGHPSSGVFAVTGSPWSGGPAQLLKLDANASDWISLGPASFTKELRGVWGAAAAGASPKLLLVGAGATVVRWQNGFTLEHPTRSISSSSLKAIWAKGPTDVVAVGEQGTILRRGPTGWGKDAWGGGADLNAVWGPDGSSLLVAVGASGTILHHDGSGWTQKTSPTATTLEAVWGKSESDIWAVGDTDPAQGNRPAIVHWNGTEWKLVPAPPETAGSWLDAVWGTGKDDEVYAAGFRQLILRYVGSSWTVASKGVVGAPAFYGMWGTAASNIYLTAEANGGVWLFDSLLGKLTAVPGPGQLWGNMWSVWGDPSRTLVAGDYGQVLNIKSGAWKAEDTGCGNALYGVWTSGGVAYAVGESGTILSSGP